MILAVAGTVSDGRRRGNASPQVSPYSPRGYLDSGTRPRLPAETTSGARADVAKGLSIQFNEPGLLELRGRLAREAGDYRGALEDSTPPASGVHKTESIFTRRRPWRRWAAPRRRSRNGRWPCDATPSSPKPISVEPGRTSSFVNGTWPSPTSSRPPRGPTPTLVSSWESPSTYFPVPAETPRSTAPLSHPGAASGRRFVGHARDSLGSAAARKMITARARGRVASLTASPARIGARRKSLLAHFGFARPRSTWECVAAIGRSDRGRADRRSS